LADTPEYLNRVTVINRIKTFVYLSCRLLFDPPTTPFALTAAEKQLEELTWRLSVNREGDEWVDPNPSLDILAWEEIRQIDGGTV
jgi:hypothetical protein